MSSIGTSAIVHTETFLVLDGESAQLAFLVDGWNVNVEFTMVAGSNNQLPIVGTVRGNGVHYAFNNWNQELGMAIPDALQVGVSPAGRRVTMRVWHGRVQTLNRVDLQFRAEAA